jgi:hypothetical protein
MKTRIELQVEASLYAIKHPPTLQECEETEDYKEQSFKFKPPCVECLGCMVRYCAQTGSMCQDFADYLARAEEEEGYIEAAESETDIHASE